MYALRHIKDAVGRCDEVTASGEDMGPVDAAECGDGAEGSDPPPSGDEDDSDDGDDRKLVWEYLAAALQPFEHFSVRGSDSPDWDDDECYYQLVALPASLIKLITFQTPVAAKDKRSFSVMVQPLTTSGDMVVPVSHVTVKDVFPVQDPEKMDLLAFVGASLDFRKNIRTWRCGASDIDECVGIHSPEMLSYRGSMQKSPPTLALLDVLTERGYKPISRKIVHSPLDELKQVDVLNPSSRTLYFQCVIAIAEIFKARAQPFTSRECTAFYTLLLKKPANATSGMSAARCKAALCEYDMDDFDPTVFAALEESRHTVPVVALHDRDVMGETESDNDPIALPAAIADALPAASKSSSSSSSSSSTSSTSSDAESVSGQDVIGDSENEIHLPKSILGQDVGVETKVAPDGSLHQGLRVKCRNAAHRDQVSCSKYRSLNVDVETFGDKAAEYYLSCWLTMDHLDADAHKATKPTRADVQLWVDTYVIALRD